MSTTSIHHRPVPFLAAAAAVAAFGAIAAGSVALAVSDHSDQPGAPGLHSQTTGEQNTPPTHHFHATTSGGHVMVGP
jgi:hypothetical protein